jgi:hypothetical protein
MTEIDTILTEQIEHGTRLIDELIPFEHQAFALDTDIEHIIPQTQSAE